MGHVREPGVPLGAQGADLRQENPAGWGRWDALAVLGPHEVQVGAEDSDRRWSLMGEKMRGTAGRDPGSSGGMRREEEEQRHAHLGRLARNTVDRPVASETVCQNGVQERAVSGTALVTQRIAAQCWAEGYHCVRVMQQPPD